MVRVFLTNHRAKKSITNAIRIIIDFKLRISLIFVSSRLFLLVSCILSFITRQ